MGRYQSPLYRSIVERAKRNERQEETMALPGKMPTRERLTELAGRIQHIFTHHGYTEEVGMTFSEMAALVKLAQDVTNAPPASDPVTGLTDPFAAEYEVVIPANVRFVRVRVEKDNPKIVVDPPRGGASTPYRDPALYLDGKPVGYPHQGRGGGSGRVVQEVWSGEPLERVKIVTTVSDPITPAIPAEPEVWPEDPRAPKPPADVPEAATDFQAGDWVVTRSGATMKVAGVKHVDGLPRLVFSKIEGDHYDPANFRHATDNEILAASSIGW